MKVCPHNISVYLQYLNMYCFHIKTNDPYDETQSQAQLWVTLTYLSRSQRLINIGSYKLYRFRIHTIYRTEYVKMMILSFFNVNIVITISQKTLGQGERR